MSDLKYNYPNFSNQKFIEAPEAKFDTCNLGGVVPIDFYATTNLPTYIKTQGNWTLVQEQRMDGCIVFEGENLVCREPRSVKQGQQVLCGQLEQGQEGIYVNAEPFISNDSEEKDIFSFMSSGHSREKPVNYIELANLIYNARQNQEHSIWVLGPAVVHSGSREDMVWLLENNFISTIFAGNALAVHDLEMSLYKTSLGLGMHGRAISGGHRHHVDTINKIRHQGGIRQAVESGLVTDGIMHSCIKNNIPYVLAGSIRDDGPLPDVITSSLEAQNIMRNYTKKTNLVVMLATALHSIAAGNMLPTFYQKNDNFYPLPIIAVDQDEFVLNKLIDRGTGQAFGVTRNAADFLNHIVLELKKLIN